MSETDLAQLREILAEIKLQVEEMKNLRDILEPLKVYLPLLKKFLS